MSTLLSSGDNNHNSIYSISLRDGASFSRGVATSRNALYIALIGPIDARSGKRDAVDGPNKIRAIQIQSNALLVIMVASRAVLLYGQLLVHGMAKLLRCMGARTCRMVPSLFARAWRAHPPRGMSALFRPPACWLDGMPPLGTPFNL